MNGYRIILLSVIFCLGITSKLFSLDYASGTGTSNDPYIVSTAEQLNNVRNNPNAHFKLGADIDLTDWLSTNSPTTGWNPIGNASTPFTGTLDGAGYFISNIWSARNESNQGLFGVVAGEVSISKLGVTVAAGKKITGTENIGIIAGNLSSLAGKKDCIFDQIYATGAIEATSKCIGGILGANNGMNLAISNCYVSGTVVSAGNATAGILGNSYGAINLLVKNCYSMSKISCDDGAVAAIVGAVSAPSTDALNATITNCLAMGSITANSASSGRICGWVKDEKITLTDNIGFDGFTINEENILSPSGSNHHGADKSKEDLTLQETYSGWDFSSTWNMGNQSYQFPALKNVNLEKQPVSEVDLDYASDNPYYDLVEEYGILNILDCGVAADGITDDTQIIQLAINACAAKKATLIFPKKTYFIRPLFLKSNITIELQSGAILQGSTKLQDYKNAFPNAGAIETSALIFGRDIKNVKIVGPGKIDGRGGASDFMLGNGVDGRPKVVHFVRCENVVLENVELINSAFWTAHFLMCDGVKIKGVKIYSHTNWNNDGLDIDSKNVEIEDCYIDCDDDGICMKSDRGVPCENVTVKNCTIRTNCNAIKLGTAGKSGFKNITYTDCVIMKASEDNFRKHYTNSKLSWLGVTIPGASVISGIAVESVDGGILDGVNISNIRMEDVHAAIFIRLGNRAQTNGYMSQLKNVTIEDVTAKTVSKLASSIVGVTGGIIENVLIKNVEITVPGGGKTSDAQVSVPENAGNYPEASMFGIVLPAHGFYVRHAKNIKFENVKINLESADARPDYVFSNVTDYKVYSGTTSPKKDKINIYQEDGKLFLIGDEPGLADIQLANMTGSVIASTKQYLDNNKQAIELPKLQKGIYIVLVKHPRENFAKKIVID